MPLFPVHRPTIGLSFSAQALSLVEVRRSWFRNPCVRRLSDRPLPPGLLRPSPSELNVTDVEALVGEVRALKESSRIRAVAVSLPDRCTQIALFEFETLPQQKADCEAVLRWRFQQDLNSSGGDMRLVYRAFRASGAAATPESQGAVAQRVLVAAIRQDILAQYEQVCEAAGLLPVSVGFTTLQLFDLWRPVMTRAAELFFARRTDDQFTFIAVRHGHPIFLRLKPVRPATANLSEELLGTLQFFEDQYPPQSEGSDARTAPLFLLDSVEEQPTVLESVGDQSRQVEVIHTPWQTLPFTGISSAPSFTGLSALASVMAR
ncbi:MAG: hypothetical protein ACREI2_07700 [Nitrospiraceae bacterium]